MEVSVGALDERLRLAPCARVEPYLPAGARLSGSHPPGSAMPGGCGALECVFPVTVKAYGPAWVLTGDVTMGTALTGRHATQAEVDWAAENTSILAEPSLWVGRSLPAT